MAVSSPKAPAAVQSARNRREFHKAKIAACRSVRDRLWQAMGWVMAETRHRPEAERTEIITAVMRLAEELNGRHERDCE